MASLAITRNVADNTGTNQGTIGLASSAYTLTNRGNFINHLDRVDFSTTLTLTTYGTNGSTGSIKLIDFPKGVVGFGGGIGSLTITKAGAGATGVADTAAIVLAVGSIVPATDSTTTATLTATEANLIPSSAFTLSSGTKSAAIGPGNFTTSFLDGSTTNVSAYLNVAIPAAGATTYSATTLLTISGNLMFNWNYLGSLA